MSEDRIKVSGVGFQVSAIGHRAWRRGPVFALRATPWQAEDRRSEEQRLKKEVEKLGR